MTQPVAKRADQLVVGDSIPDEHLAFRFNQGPARVVFVAQEDGPPLPWTFVAYRYPNGQHDSMTVRPEAEMRVYPADAGRPDFVDGPCLDSDCPNASWPHSASSDLAEPDPTGMGYSRADDGETTQPIAGRVPAHFGAVEVAGGLVDIDPPEGYFIVPHGPVKPPYGSPEREAYDREHGASPVIHVSLMQAQTQCGIAVHNLPPGDTFVSTWSERSTCSTCADQAPF